MWMAWYERRQAYIVKVKIIKKLSNGLAIICKPQLSGRTTQAQPEPCAAGQGYCNTIVFVLIILLRLSEI